MLAPTVHAEGHGFTEGPAVLPDGSIAFVDMINQTIWHHRDGETVRLARVAGSPNGMRLGADGALYIANNGGFSPSDTGILALPDPIPGCIQRLGLDGRVSDYVVGLPGEGPWRPNDLVFAADGTLVFTDPQNWEALDGLRDTGAYKGGRLFAAGPDRVPRHLIDLPGLPNGLAFHPDGFLLVALTLDRKIVRLDWSGGAVDAPADWCLLDNAMPDGILFVGDYLFVAGSVCDTLTIVDRNGQTVRILELEKGGSPTNLATDGTRLWLTMGSRGQLVSFSLADLI